VSVRHDNALDIVQRDSAFHSVVASSGPAPAWRPAPVTERFATLIRSITFQLLATSAANTIHARVVDACGGVVTTDSVLGAGPDILRAVGLSRTKAAAMIDLAAHVHDGRVNLARHGRMSDVQIMSEVTAVHGVGPWTTQMYLMHTLGRRDVWPVGDFGVRSGWSRLHGLEKIISEKQLRECGEVFAGLRSDVAWFCWRAVDVKATNR
jgi:DNA-3-methyladenine glycosylase II